VLSSIVASRKSLIIAIHDIYCASR
jgi:hypothetical protein